jgi:ribosome-associated toxin RatA of RatAB toxin-antitoxin module
VPVVEHSAIVAVAIDDAFDLSQSYGLRLEWDPFIKSQRLLDGATVGGKGVQTLTLSRHGLRMVSEYLTFRRPESVAMKMVEGPMMFRLFSGSWQFKRIDDAKTTVVFKYHFTCRPTWLHWIMHPVGRWFLGREIRRRLLAFKKAAETPGMIAELHAEIAAIAEGSPQ